MTVIVPNRFVKTYGDQAHRHTKFIRFHTSVSVVLVYIVFISCLSLVMYSTFLEAFSLLLPSQKGTTNASPRFPFRDGFISLVC